MEYEVSCLRFWASYYLRYLGEVGTEGSSSGVANSYSLRAWDHRLCLFRCFCFHPYLCLLLFFFLGGGDGLGLALLVQSSHKTLFLSLAQTVMEMYRYASSECEAVRLEATELLKEKMNEVSTCVSYFWDCGRVLVVQGLVSLSMVLHPSSVPSPSPDLVAESFDGLCPEGSSFPRAFAAGGSGAVRLCPKPTQQALSAASCLPSSEILFPPVVAAWMWAPRTPK